MNRLIIIGAGGQGKVLADNAFKNGYTNISFIDDYVTGSCVDFPIIGTSAHIEALQDDRTDFVIGIGNNEIRKKIAQRQELNWATLIHPSAQIGLGVSVGAGSVIMAGAIVNACATIGRHCIINTGAVVEHDNVIEDYVHISPGAALGGTVRIGELTHVGIGAAVRNNITICSMCVIGAGAVVIRDIEQRGTYIGIPAKEVL